MNRNLIKEPLISVIMPAYNAGRYIVDSINSVLAQTYGAYEIIVVDDGSTDNTVKLVETFGSKVSLFRQENSGVSKSRNFAVSKAKGFWIAFLDSDDLWAPDKLDVQMRGLKNGARWSHTNSLYFGENQDGCTSRSDLSKQYGGLVHTKLIEGNFITTSTVLMEKEFFIELGGFDESLPALEDWLLWVEASKLSELSYQPELLCKYRVYSGSTSRKARFVLPLHLRVIDLIYNDLQQVPNFSRLYKVTRANSYGVCSYIAEDASDNLFSFKCALGALINDPLNFSRLKRVIRTILNIITSPLK